MDSTELVSPKKRGHASCGGLVHGAICTLQCPVRGLEGMMEEDVEEKQITMNVIYCLAGILTHFFFSRET